MRGGEGVVKGFPKIKERQRARQVRGITVITIKSQRLSHIKKDSKGRENGASLAHHISSSPSSPLPSPPPLNVQRAEKGRRIPADTVLITACEKASYDGTVGCAKIKSIMGGRAKRDLKEQKTRQHSYPRRSRRHFWEERRGNLKRAGILQGSKRAEILL